MMVPWWRPVLAVLWSIRWYSSWACWEAENARPHAAAASCCASCTPSYSAPVPLPLPVNEKSWEYAYACLVHLYSIWRQRNTPTAKGEGQYTDMYWRLLWCMQRKVAKFYLQQWVFFGADPIIMIAHTVYIDQSYLQVLIATAPPQACKVSVLLTMPFKASKWKSMEDLGFRVSFKFQDCYPYS